MAYDVRFISQADVESLGISMKEVMDGVETGWRMNGEGKTELPAKIGIHPRGNCYIHAMPCWIGGDTDMAGMKWVAGFPMNLEKRLPYNNGIFVLNDTETGVVKAIMDCNWMTTWRTGAAAGLGAKYFAAPDSAVVAVIGLGTIGKITLRAFKEVLPAMKYIKIYDPIAEQYGRFIDEMRELLPGVEFIKCGSLVDSCAYADVVTSCAPILDQPRRSVSADMLKENICCITSDYDSTLCADTVSGGCSFVCDDRGQYLWTQEHGVYFQNGYPLAEGIYADMGEIIAGKKPPVLEGRRVCLFMGIASHDVMTAKLILEKAAEKNAGTMLKL